MLKQLKILYFSAVWQTFRKLAFCGVLVASHDSVVNQRISLQILGQAAINPIVLVLYLLLLLNAVAGCYDILFHFRQGSQGSPRHKNTCEIERPLTKATSQIEG